MGQNSFPRFCPIVLVINIIGLIHYQFLSILAIFGNAKASVFTQFSKYHDQELSLLTTFGRDHKNNSQSECWKWEQNQPHLYL